MSSDNQGEKQNSKDNDPEVSGCHSQPVSSSKEEDMSPDLGRAA
jgi:hypothetical protein